MGFPGNSVGKESACNAGNPSSIPGSGRSPGEGLVYPLHCSWASLVAQAVKNPPAIRETWVRFLSWEDPLEKGTATHSSILAWRIPWTEEPGELQSMGSQRVRHDWATHFHFQGNILESIDILEHYSLCSLYLPHQVLESWLLQSFGSTIFKISLHAIWG